MSEIEHDDGIPEGAIVDVPADWVDWADVDEDEARPWSDAEIEDARKRAEEIFGKPHGVTAAFWDPSKHPRHPAGDDRGGEFEAKLHQAFHDKAGSRVYLDGEGNYRYRKPGNKPGGPIPDWNDAVKEVFGTDQIAFHNAAKEYIRPITLPG